MIDRITAGREPGPAVLVGPGDDAAVVAMPDARVVVTTDMLVQGRHFRTDWSTPQQIGGKAIAQNGADIAAMGARPQGYVVALGCPPDTPLAMLDALNEGMRQEAVRSGAEIVGGDLVQSPEIVVSVTALGDLEGRVPVLRSGARIGDVVAVAGTLGRSAAGMAALEAGMSGFEDLVALHCWPQPPYPAGVAAAVAGATAMCDVSDGLLADLGHIADASGVGIDLARARIGDPRVLAAGAALGLDPSAWLLSGGEDHALVATFPPDTVLPEGWRAIGRVDDGAGVRVDGAQWSGAAGWQSWEVR